MVWFDNKMCSMVCVCIVNGVHSDARQAKCAQSRLFQLLCLISCYSCYVLSCTVNYWYESFQRKQSPVFFITFVFSLLTNLSLTMYENQANCSTYSHFLPLELFLIILYSYVPDFHKLTILLSTMAVDDTYNYIRTS